MEPFFVLCINARAAYFVRKLSTANFCWRIAELRDSNISNMFLITKPLSLQPSPTKEIKNVNSWR